MLLLIFDSTELKPEMILPQSIKDGWTANLWLH